jgi:hypothetical protein
LDNIHGSNGHFLTQKWLILIANVSWIFTEGAIDSLTNEVIKVMTELDGGIDLEAFNWQLETTASAVLNDELALARKRNYTELFHQYKRFIRFD